MKKVKFEPLYSGINKTIYLCRYPFNPNEEYYWSTELIEAYIRDYPEKFPQGFKTVVSYASLGFFLLTIYND